jgi:glycosyltransferase involved in cell wall biosynthesis
MYKEHKIGVVIPAHNEENHIKDTVETLPDFVDKIYVVDDGCTDKTSEIVKKRLLRRLQISEFI